MRNGKGENTRRARGETMIRIKKGGWNEEGNGGGQTSGGDDEKEAECRWSLAVGDGGLTERYSSERGSRWKPQTEEGR